MGYYIFSELFAGAEITDYIEIFVAIIFFLIIRKIYTAFKKAKQQRAAIKSNSKKEQEKAYIDYQNKLRIEAELKAAFDKIDAEIMARGDYDDSKFWE